MPPPGLHQQLEVEPHPYPQKPWITNGSGFSESAHCDSGLKPRHCALVKNVKDIKDEPQLHLPAELEELFQSKVEGREGRKSL